MSINKSSSNVSRLKAVSINRSSNVCNNNNGSNNSSSRHDDNHPNKRHHNQSPSKPIR